MGSNPLRGLFGVSSPRTVAPQHTEPTENENVYFDSFSYVDFVSTTCVNMCQVKPLESFKGGYHPIIPHHNHLIACWHAR